jgi:holo-[acyl-carrier protein] synthase
MTAGSYARPAAFLTVVSANRMCHEPTFPTGTRPGSLRVGVDIISVREVSRSLERFGDRYVRRVFTTDEADYCRAANGSAAAARFAVRFAAKEATLKALRPEAMSFDWRSIEVRRHASGRCEIVLHGEAAAVAACQGIETLALSMSHDRTHAAAVVVAQAVSAGHREARDASRHD